MLADILDKHWKNPMAYSDCLRALEEADTVRAREFAKFLISLKGLEPWVINEMKASFREYLDKELEKYPTF